jgi:hypothetical protein
MVGLKSGNRAWTPPVRCTVTTTSALRGMFLDDGRCCREFLDFDGNTT